MFSLRTLQFIRNAYKSEIFIFKIEALFFSYTLNSLLTATKGPKETHYKNNRNSNLFINRNNKYYCCNSERPSSIERHSLKKKCKCPILYVLAVDS